jgi:DNA-binding response OmpR family regulator
MNNTTQVPRVLLVDDEPDITIGFKAMLEHKGFRVDTFNDPLAALEGFQPGNYDILVLDIRMPKMDGFKLFEELRKLDKDIKVVFVTAFDVNYEALRTIYPELTIDSFIRKPVGADSLANTLRRELDRPSGLDDDHL